MYTKPCRAHGHGPVHRNDDGTVTCWKCEAEEVETFPNSVDAAACIEGRQCQVGLDGRLVLSPDCPFHGRLIHPTPYQPEDIREAW